MKIAGLKMKKLMKTGIKRKTEEIFALIYNGKICAIPGYNGKNFAPLYSNFDNKMNLR